MALARSVALGGRRQVLLPGRVTAAIEATAATRSLGESHGDPRLQAYADWTDEWALSILDDFDGAIRRAESQAQAMDPFSLGIARGNLGNVYLERREPTPAIPLLEEAVALFRRSATRSCRAISRLTWPTPCARLEPRTEQKRRPKRGYSAPSTPASSTRSPPTSGRWGASLVTVAISGRRDPAPDLVRGLLTSRVALPRRVDVLAWPSRRAATSGRGVSCTVGTTATSIVSRGMTRRRGDDRSRSHRVPLRRRGCQPCAGSSGGSRTQHRGDVEAGC